MEKSVYVGPGLANTSALLTFIERDRRLDAQSRKIVLDSLAAGVASASNNSNAGGRKSRRAASAWFRHLDGRMKIAAQERLARRSRPGAFQRRRPNARPFNPTRCRAITDDALVVNHDANATSTSVEKANA